MTGEQVLALRARERQVQSELARPQPPDRLDQLRAELDRITDELYGDSSSQGEDDAWAMPCIC